MESEDRRPDLKPSFSILTPWQMLDDAGPRFGVSRTISEPTFPVSMWTSAISTAPCWTSFTVSHRQVQKRILGLR